MKNIIRKNATNHEWRTKDRKAFYERLHVVCDKLVGKGYFELFPLHSLKLMYNLRYPFIRFAPENRKTIGSDEILLLKLVIAKKLGTHKVETLTGEKMPCSRFLSEAMLLIHYVQYRIGGTFRGKASLARAFAPYFTKTEWYKNNRKTILELIVTSGLLFYDTTRGMLWVDTERMGIVSAWEANIIRLYRVSLQTCQQEIDEKKRLLIRMCIPNLDIPEPEWISATPGQFGFGNEVDIPVPLYIQQHALNRFVERASLPAGLAQVCINKDLQENTVKFVKRNEYSLVECRVSSGHKIGYFVVSFHVDKLVIRTFLFLTNDGTPEGRRLLKMTHLERLDTQYLKIDRLSTFYTYDVGNDQQLRQLFTAAGCASLLDLTAEFNNLNDLHLQSPEYIHQYLAHLFLMEEGMLTGPKPV